jgi:hypothetical protein
MSEAGRTLALPCNASANHVAPALLSSTSFFDGFRISHVNGRRLVDIYTIISNGSGSAEKVFYVLMHDMM